MQRVSDTPLPCLFSDRLWSRIGAEEDGCFTVDPTGCNLANGGFNATLQDVTRFGQVHLDGGISEGRQVVPAPWVQDMRSGSHGLFNDSGRSRFPKGAVAINTGLRIRTADGAVSQCVWPSDLHRARAQSGCGEVFDRARFF